MLQFLKGWIISVATMVIFMVLIDLILPSNNFKKYAKFVTGLIVIITILAPVFKLFDSNLDVDAFISNYTDSFNKSYSNVDKNKINNSVQKQTLDVYKDNLKKSIEKELFNETGKRYSVAKLEVNEEYLSNNYCEIKSVDIRRITDEKSIKTVDKIVINKDAEDQEAPKDNKVIEILENKYNISSSLIKFVK